MSDTIVCNLLIIIMIYVPVWADVEYKQNKYEPLKYV